MNKHYKVAGIYFEHAIESYERNDYHLFEGDTDLDNGCHVISMMMQDGAMLYMKYSSLGPSVFILDKNETRMLLSLNSLPMPFLKREASIKDKILGWLR